ncbi:MAG: cell wall-binding repeat-containing protein, partial [Firmicutes bacterium]|nr:cell wall-binding repeat-containing protein [Bacillota bacterium]
EGADPVDVAGSEEDIGTEPEEGTEETVEQTVEETEVVEPKDASAETETEVAETETEPVITVDENGKKPAKAGKETGKTETSSEKQEETEQPKDLKTGETTGEETNKQTDGKTEKETGEQTGEEADNKTGEQPEEPATEEPVTEEEKPAIEPGIERFSGDDRYQTALAIADALKKELGIKLFDTVVIASGMNYPDALSGSYLAKVKQAPIILVDERSASLVADYLKKNLKKSGFAYILGGTGSVSQKAEKALKLAKSKRLAGKDRYETNLLVLEEAGIEKGSEILICSGNNFADAIAASATGKPILLVGNELSAEQKAFLKKNKGGTVYIVGGTGSVSEKIEKVAGKYGETKRVAGNNRYETSIALAEEFFAETEQVAVATGAAFPDALAGGPLAQAKECPLVLTVDASAFQTTYEYLRLKENLKRVSILGGAGMVPETTLPMTADGSLRKGLFEVGKRLYLAKNDGALADEGYVTYAAKRYFVTADRHIARDELFTTGGKTYGAKADGEIAKEEVFKAGGKTYYADKNSVVARNQLIKVGDKTYGATEDGSLAENGWAKAGAYTYYFKNFEVNKVCLQALELIEDGVNTLMDMYFWANSIPFVLFDTVSNPDWGSLWYAGYGFTKEQGNCYVKSGVFFIMAKMCGYDVKHITAAAPHAWVQLKEDGVFYIWDVGYHAGPIEQEEYFWERSELGYRYGWREMPMEYVPSNK